MCGIVGVYDLNTEDYQDTLRRMCAEIVHRGPDDEGFYVDGRFGLGIRRLSIIDLAGGHQPISNEDGTKWIVFNGEVYNYRELRPHLEKQGHRFRTNSDTEVILHQYEQDGPDCVHKLNGMFAFAILDTSEQTLFLARDRLGIKPLYYYQDGRKFIFASEIKAILASGLVEKRLNEQAVWDYLTFRYVPGPQTIWQNIYRLPPGHTLSLSARRPQPVIQRYWDIRYQDGIKPKTEDEYLEEFSELFLEAVRLRLIADVPVGILLSGGLDSSSVAVAIGEVHNARLSSFSVAFEEGGQFSELSYARQTARRVGTDHNEIVISVPEFMDFLPDFVRFTDEPLADLASVPLYYVSKLARERVKVVLSGEGSDEVLAGYDFDQCVANWQKIGRIQRLPSLVRDTVPKWVATSLGAAQLAAKIERFNQPIGDHNIRTLPHMTNYFGPEEKRQLWNEPPSYPDSMLKIKADYAASQTDELLHQMLYVYCQSWLVEDLLMKADRMTMANSLELRVPFLDHRLVEWTARVPAWLKVGRDKGGNGNLVTKYVLRRFASKRLPGEILTRTKQGFPVPVYGWLRTHLRQWAGAMLLDGDSQAQHWFNKEALGGWVEAGTSDTSSATDQHKLWILLVFELWARQWEPG